jgi:molecular chaperone GrpE (heat shock protein)
VFKWLRGWFGKAESSMPGVDERALALEREAQMLRLELQERDRFIAELKADMTRVVRGAERAMAEGLLTAYERLLSEFALPFAQFLTQEYLLEVEGKPVQARDVLAVARRLLRLLEDEGLTAEGRIGDTVAFDPDRHEPLGGDFAPNRGEPAVVRMVGVSWHGRVLRKTVVGPR